jgi:hypothetical protein
MPSDKEIEAAALAIYYNRHARGEEVMPWEKVKMVVRAIFYQQAKAALEAAEKVRPDLAAELKAKGDRIAELEGQLPEGMKYCTIIFKECEVGHGRLTAKNWIDNGCTWCRIEQAKQALSKE